MKSKSPFPLWASWAGMLITLVVMIIIPLVTTDQYLIGILTRFSSTAILVAALNLVAGYCGQLSLGHGGLLGIGAYTYILLVQNLHWNTWLALIGGAVLAAVLAWPIGLVLLRSKGSYFAVGSLAFGMLILIVLEQWTDLTRGPKGIVVSKLSPIFGLDVAGAQGQYYVALGLLVFSLICMYLVINSLVGRSFMAIRENEDLARSVGISTMRTKVLAFVISAFFAGLAGGFKAGFVSYITPDQVASVNAGFDPLVYLVVGGMGTLVGPVVGTGVLFLIPEVLQGLLAYKPIIYGVILILVMIFLPMGLWGKLKFWVLRRGERAAGNGPKVVKDNAA